MTETNGGVFYSRHITTTPPQPTGEHNDDHSISSSGGQDNTTANNDLGTEQPATLYLEIDEPSARSAPGPDQALRTPAPSVPLAVPPDQPSSFYPPTNPTPFAANHGYVSEQQPPPYDQLYGKENPGFNPGPQVHQSQPWGKHIQPNIQKNVTLTSQPKLVPSVPSAVPPNQSSNFYPPTNQTPFAAIHGYLPEQQPPRYDQLYGKEISGFPPGPQVHQPQPRGKHIKPNVQRNVVVTSQPQPVPPEVMHMRSHSQRNTLKGLAIASLILSVVGMFCCPWTTCCTLPGLIYAATSLENSEGPEKAKTHAKISMCYTAIGLIISIISVVIFVMCAISQAPSVSGYTYNSYY